MKEFKIKRKYIIYNGNYKVGLIYYLAKRKKREKAIIIRNLIFF